MNMKATSWIIAGSLLALGYGGYRLYEIVAPNESDQVRIERALDHSIQAGRKGEAGGVLDLISRKLKVNDSAVGEDRGGIANFIRQSKPDVIVHNKKAQVFDDEARIVSPIDLSLEPFGQRQLQQVTLIFRKEKDTVYGIVPSVKWKLVDIRLEDNAMMDLVGF
jgi:hypothetical protein